MNLALLIIAGFGVACVIVIAVAGRAAHPPLSRVGRRASAAVMARPREEMAAIVASRLRADRERRRAVR